MQKPTKRHLDLMPTEDGWLSVRHFSEGGLCSTPTLGPARRYYMAGYFDGEGCIRFRDGTIVVHIDTTYPKMLAAFATYFGGRVVEQIRTDPGRRKRTYRWEITGPRALKFCRSIRPYLTEKFVQCQIAILLKNTKPNTPTRRQLEALLKRQKRIEYTADMEYSK